MSDIKQGDTVRNGIGDEATVVAGPDATDSYVLDPGNGNWFWGDTTNWVKVEPTPADCFVVIDGDGDFTSAHEVYSYAYGHAEHLSGGRHAPYRVARFAFAEWVES